MKAKQSKAQTYREGGAKTRKWEIQRGGTISEGVVA